MVQRLVEQLAQSSAQHIARVVVTHNIPEPALTESSQAWPFVVERVLNPKPLGFGENHNNALRGAKEPLVCVLNPDVELIAGQEPFAALIATACEKAVGCAYPTQVDEHGTVQDSERELPSPWALWKRRALHQPQRYVDWVNAAFIVVPAAMWHAVGGFDTRYFMYCEDVDLSLRLQLQGGVLRRAGARVIHRGERASSKQWQHLRWHVQSLLRLWTSRAFWQYCRRGVPRHPL